MYKQVGHRTQYVPWGDGAGGAQDFSPKAFLVDMLEKAILGNRIICTNSENEKSFLITKVTTELFLRGRLDGKIAIIVSTAMDELDAYRQTFTVSTAIKEVEIVLDTHEFSLIDFSKAQVILTLPKTVKKLFEFIRRSNLSPDEKNLTLPQCGLLIIDNFESRAHHSLLEQVDSFCDTLNIDKPHTLGLTSHILKNTRSADQLKQQIYELETSSGCKVETSGEFSVSGVFDEKVIVCDYFETDLKMELESALQGPLMFLLSCSELDNMEVSNEYPAGEEITRQELHGEEYRSDESSGSETDAETSCPSENRHSINTTDKEADLTSPEPPETETENEDYEEITLQPEIHEVNYEEEYDDSIDQLLIACGGGPTEPLSPKSKQAQLHRRMQEMQEAESSTDEMTTDQLAEYYAQKREFHQEEHRKKHFKGSHQRYVASSDTDTSEESGTRWKPTVIKRRQKGQEFDRRTPSEESYSEGTRKYENTGSEHEFDAQYTDSEIAELEFAERDYVGDNLQCEYQTDTTEGSSDSSDSSDDEENRLDDIPEEVEKDFKDDPMGIPLVFLSEAKLLLEQLGPWALYRFYQTNIRYLQRRAKLETRYNHVIGLELLMTSLRKIYVICDERMRTTGFSRDFVTTKVARLMDVLREYKPEVKQRNPDSQFNDRDNANYVSWHNDQNLDVDDVGSDEAPGPTPFTNRLWGCVLVNERPVAKYLGKILKDAARADPDLAHISSQALCQLVKVDNPNGHIDEEEIADEKKKQEEALHKFRTREANILIAQAETENEAHRHFDIPKCNLVVRFDAPGSYLRYDGGKRLLSQQNDALYGILINKKEKIQFCKMLEEFKMLEEYLKNRASLAEEAGPVELCLDLDVTHLFEEMPKDYHNNENGAVEPDYLEPEDEPENLVHPEGWRRKLRPQIKLSMQNSLSLLNKYCNRLPCDSFTQLSVLRKTLQLANGKFQTSLVLPNNSHLRGIVVGKPQETAELSKRSAALEACTKLRILGELDDFLFNSSKEMDKYKFEIDPFPNPLSRKRKPPPGMEGGPKRRQKYPRHIPRSLRAKPKDSKAEGASALPVPEQECYVYRISMFYRHGLADKYNYRGRKLHRPEDFSKSFAIISAQPIPHTISGFSIFDRSGEEGVNLEPIHHQVCFSATQLEIIKSFHQYIIQDVIRIERPGGVVQFNPDKSPVPFLIAPVDCDSGIEWEIDWDYLTESIAGRVLAKEAAEAERRVNTYSEEDPFIFHKSEYEDSVVICSYRRHDAPTQNRFYVAEIQYDMDPDSPFPADDYESFRQYYMQRWALCLTNEKQPLLDVDHTDCRLNLLTPRFVTQKGRALPASALEKKRQKYEDKANRQYLIPEILDVHPVSASLWRKAVCLPSILHRITCLLAAEDLRRRISRQTRVGLIIPPVGMAFPHLQLDWEDPQTVPNSEPFCKHPALPKNYPYFDQKEKEEDEIEVETTQLEFPFTAIETTTDFENYILKNSCLESSLGEKNLFEEIEGDCKNEMITSLDDEEEISDEYISLQAPEINPDVEEGEFGPPLPPNFDTKVLSAAQLKLKEKEDQLKAKEREIFSKIEEGEFPSGDDLPDLAELVRNEKKKEEVFPVVEVPRTVGLHNVENVGPTPDQILQTLTLSKSSDGFNLERLEMLGDCFLKYSVTVYLYCKYEHQHEGQLSFFRSKKVSNRNLFRLGVYNDIPGRMVAEQFMQNDTGGNWLPPGYFNKDHAALESDDSEDEDGFEFEPAKGERPQELNDDDSEIESAEDFDGEDISMVDEMLQGSSNQLMSFLDRKKQLPGDEFDISVWKPLDTKGKPINTEEPLIYNHYSDQYLTDKSIADCMEALIGAYLKATGIEATQQFLCHMGLIVLPSSSCEPETGKPLPPFLPLAPPIEPFHLKSCSQLEKMQRLQALEKLTRPYGEFEKKIGYTFKNKGYLLQSLTHASYQYNQVTNCYQRLEFLGDAVLDFLITRHLFDHPTKRFSPGELTDLRAALVNNNIFAALAVKFDFHKYLYALTPDLHNVIRDYVLYCQTRQDVEGMEAVLKRIRLEEEPEEEEGDHEDSEDIEVPKVLGDIYESVAGAIYLDSGMNLDAVWGVYRPMLQKYIDKYSINPPRSPIRELLELEPETAKFSAPEKRADGKYRVTVHIANNKGRFAGAGRNHKAAKASAARAALNWLKKTTAEIEDGIED